MTHMLWPGAGAQYIRRKRERGFQQEHVQDFGVVHIEVGVDYGGLEIQVNRAILETQCSALANHLLDV